jgi:hypothetical protein
MISFVTIPIVAGVFLALMQRPSSSLGGVFMRGLAVLTTALLLVRWSSPDYYAFAFAVFAAAVLLADVPQREHGGHSPLNTG